MLASIPVLILLFLIIYFLSKDFLEIFNIHFSIYSIFSLSQKGAFYIFIGYIGHLICDLLNHKKIPFFHPSGKKFSLSFISTGTDKEIIFRNLLWLILIFQIILTINNLI